MDQLGTVAPGSVTIVRGQPAASVSTDSDPLLVPQIAAVRMALSPATLARHRRFGTGPRFIRLSATRVAYRQSAIDAWLAERERGSTLES